MIKIEKTALDGVLVITPPVVYEDHRGTNTESYNEKIYKEAGIKTDFVLDSVSTSRKNVIRGIHGDSHTTKLVYTEVSILLSLTMIQNLHNIANGFL